MAFTISGTGGLTFPDSTTMTTGSQACKAWVKFAGSSGTISASFNVSSVTVRTTGTYTVNFTSSLTDANYSVATCGSNTGAGDGGWVSVDLNGGAPAVSAAAVPIICYSNSGAAQNYNFVYVSVFR